MYDNIGTKIKILAKIMFWLGSCLGVGIGILMWLVDEREPTGWVFFVRLLVLFGSPFIAWASTFVLYGFGELIDKTDEIAQNTRQGIGKHKAEIEEIEEEGLTSIPQKKCPRCGTEHDFDYPKCPNCKYDYHSQL